MALTVTAVADALAGVGVNLTPAERAVAEDRVAEGMFDALTAVEVALDERVGPDARVFNAYPDVHSLMGAEPPVVDADPEPEPEPVEQTDPEPEPEVEDETVEASAEAEFPEIGEL